MIAKVVKFFFSLIGFAVLLAVGDYLLLQHIDSNSNGPPESQMEHCPVASQEKGALL